MQLDDMQPGDMQLVRIPQTQSSEPPSSEAQRSEHPENGLTRVNTLPSVSPPGSTHQCVGARASGGARARARATGPQHPRVQQRIPTLNLILNLNPKLDLIPKLITVATPPDTHPRHRDPPPPHTHTHPHPPRHPHQCADLLCSWRRRSNDHKRKMKPNRSG